MSYVRSEVSAVGKQSKVDFWINLLKTLQLTGTDFEIVKGELRIFYL